MKLKVVHAAQVEYKGFTLTGPDAKGRWTDRATNSVYKDLASAKRSIDSKTRKSSPPKVKVYHYDIGIDAIVGRAPHGQYRLKSGRITSAHGLVILRTDKDVETAKEAMRLMEESRKLRSQAIDLVNTLDLLRHSPEWQTENNPR